MVWEGRILQGQRAIAAFEPTRGHPMPMKVREVIRERKEKMDEEKEI
jgi:hypothetical protein